MTEEPEITALTQAAAVCATHQESLGEALVDLDSRGLIADDLAKLDKADRRLLDQFAYRYTRLQDDMGARLFPAVLRALGEDVAAMPAIDRFVRLEQLGWLPDAEEWTELRHIRNEFSHEYPESVEQRFARLELAFRSARRLTVILDGFKSKLADRFGIHEAERH
jgi:hypothetical protein